MLLVECPVCGCVGDEVDFHYGGEAHIVRPSTVDVDGVTDVAQRDYLYMRRNPRGIHFERWRCDRGCGKWFHAVRDTESLSFLGYYLIDRLPPLKFRRLIDLENPWSEFFSGLSKPSQSGVRKKKSQRKRVL